MHCFAREGIRLDDRSMVGVLVPALFFVRPLHERTVKVQKVFDFKGRRAWNWRCGSSVVDQELSLRESPSSQSRTEACRSTSYRNLNSATDIEQNHAVAQHDVTPPGQPFRKTTVSGIGQARCSWNRSICTLTMTGPR